MEKVHDEMVTCKDEDYLISIEDGFAKQVIIYFNSYFYYIYFIYIIANF